MNSLTRPPVRQQADLEPPFLGAGSGVAVIGQEEGDRQGPVVVEDGHVLNYRNDALLARNLVTGAFEEVCQDDLHAVEAVPEFAARWAATAAEEVGNDMVITATINSSGACPIGEGHLCGKYCFAHASWSDDTSPRVGAAANYERDAQMLREKGLGAHFFMSYDTEPFPGGVIQTISKAVLRKMIEQPPEGVLIHSHTAGIGDPDVVELIAELSAKCRVIAGIGFETDSDDVGDKPHAHTVAERLEAFRRLSEAGVFTQASTTPLLGFINYPDFVARLADAGAYRFMIGELRKEFEGGGDQRAKELDIGLNPLCEDEALEVCSNAGFGERTREREHYYVAMT